MSREVFLDIRDKLQETRSFLNAFDWIYYSLKLKFKMIKKRF